jgi:hypothetical protein
MFGNSVLADSDLISESGIYFRSQLIEPSNELSPSVGCGGSEVLISLIVRDSNMISESGSYFGSQLIEHSNKLSPSLGFIRSDVLVSLTLGNSVLADSNLISESGISFDSQLVKHSNKLLPSVGVGGSEMLVSLIMGSSVLADSNLILESGSYFESQLIEHSNELSGTTVIRQSGFPAGSVAISFSFYSVTGRLGYSSGFCTSLVSGQSVSFLPSQIAKASAKWLHSFVTRGSSFFILSRVIGDSHKFDASAIFSRSISFVGSAVQTGSGLLSCGVLLSLTGSSTIAELPWPVASRHSGSWSSDGSVALPGVSFSSVISSLNEQGSSDSAPSLTAVTVGVVIGMVVLFAIGFVLFFVLTRRSREKTEVSVEPEEMTEFGDVSDNSIALFEEWSEAVSKIAASFSADADEAFDLIEPDEEAFD